MTKERKSIHISAEAHSFLLQHLERLQKDSQQFAKYPINAPNIEAWVSEAIMEKIYRTGRNFHS